MQVIWRGMWRIAGVWLVPDVTTNSAREPYSSYRYSAVTAQPP
jgi:hypothetical protein